MKSQMLIRVLPWINEELRDISRRKGISKNAFITTAILEKIEKEERG